MRRLSFTDGREGNVRLRRRRIFFDGNGVRVRPVGRDDRVIHPAQKTNADPVTHLSRLARERLLSRVPVEHRFVRPARDD
jgi:hypothetical protein